MPAHHDRDSVFAGHKAGQNGSTLRVIDNSLESNQTGIDMPKTEMQVLHFLNS